MIEIGDHIFLVGDKSYTYRPLTKSWLDGRGETAVAVADVPPDLVETAKSLALPEPPTAAGALLAQVAAKLGKLGLTVKELLDDEVERAEEPAGAQPVKRGPGRPRKEPLVE